MKTSTRRGQRLPRAIGKGADILQDEHQYLLAHRPRSLKNAQRRYARFCCDLRVRILRAARDERRRTVELPSGMAIHHLSLHEKNGARWIAMPVEKHTNRSDGKTSFEPLVEFVSRQVAGNFRRQVIQALEAKGLA